MTKHPKALIRAIQAGIDSQGWSVMGMQGSWTKAVAPVEAYIQRRIAAALRAEKRREWVGLTESEITSLHDYYVKRLGPVEFACAIEAALKEKNK